VENAAKRQNPSDDEYRSAAELRLAIRTFLRRSERVSRAHKLTPQRYQLLLQIRASDGQATVGGLSRSLLLGQSNVTQQVRRLENAGLVRRVLSKTDARVRYVRLTREGERRLAGAVAELTDDRDALIAALEALSS
jgi:DNA-binding MarR family transcriptional regulator